MEQTINRGAAMDLTNQLFLPIISTVSGGAIIIFVEKYFKDFRGISFMGYPNIEGKYCSWYPEDKDAGIEHIDIEQFGSRIKGTIKYLRNGRQGRFDGSVTRSGFIMYQISPENKINSDQYSVGFLRLNRDQNGAEGYLLYVDETGQYPTSVKVRVKEWEQYCKEINEERVTS